MRTRKQRGLDIGARDRFILEQVARSRMLPWSEAEVAIPLFRFINRWFATCDIFVIRNTVYFSLFILHFNRLSPQL
jgi:hypothetical protein